MNIDHLRKQAKTLHRILPTFLLEHPAPHTLSQSQALIARINGFRSWEQMTAAERAAATQTEQTPRNQQQHTPDTKDRNGTTCREIYKPVKGPLTIDVFTPRRQIIPTDVEALIFAEIPGSERWRRFLDTTTPSLMRLEVSYESQEFADFEEVDDTIEESILPYLEESPSSYLLDANNLSRLENIIKDLLIRFPGHLDAYCALTGLYEKVGRWAASEKLLKPVAGSLLRALPADETIKLPRLELGNRPFHRLMHCYVLALHRLAKHKEANAISRRMMLLCTHEDLPFWSGLLTKRSRDQSL